MSKVATVRTEVRHVVKTMQQTIDLGMNGFGIELLAENLGDNEKLTEGGVMFIWPHDHKKRPIWVIVTAQAPFMESVKEGDDEAVVEKEG